MIWTRLKITTSDNTLPSPFFVEEISNLLIISGVDTFTEETATATGVYYDHGPDVMKVLLEK